MTGEEFFNLLVDFPAKGRARIEEHLELLDKRTLWTAATADDPRLELKQHELEETVQSESPKVYHKIVETYLKNALTVDSDPTTVVKAIIDALVRNAAHLWEARFGLEKTAAYRNYFESVTWAIRKTRRDDAIKLEVRKSRLQKEQVENRFVKTRASSPRSTSAADAPTPAADTTTAPKGKRGRPAEIPLERKQRALVAKKQGAPQREYAKILYGTARPTPSQVKNAWSNVDYFEKSSEELEDS